MILYNVTVQTEPEIEQDWIQWMQQEHIPELLATGLFTEARLCRLTQQPEDSAPTYAAQYFFPDQTSYDTYLDTYAPAMRQKGIDRFGSRFVAFRTVLEVLSVHP
ncbi:MAG: DUF4286 family protein [Sphingobacteriales bacterium]|nr:MAG: DUF4286 family protein [Sphingobacteriales bacterium]